MDGDLFLVINCCQIVDYGGGVGERDSLKNLLPDYSLKWTSLNESLLLDKSPDGVLLEKCVNRGSKSNNQKVNNVSELTTTCAHYHKC